MLISISSSQRHSWNTFCYILDVRPTVPLYKSQESTMHMPVRDILTRFDQSRGTNFLSKRKAACLLLLCWSMCTLALLYISIFRLFLGNSKASRTLWCFPPLRTSERDTRYCTRTWRNKIMAFAVDPAYFHKFHLSMVSVAVRYILPTVS